MSFKSEITGGLEFLEDELLDIGGATQKLILPAGAEIPCVPSMEDSGSDIQIGPNMEVLSCVVTVRRSHFITADSEEITADSDVILADNETPFLRSGKKPTFRTKVYRVLKVQESPCRAYFKIFLGSPK